MTNDSDVRVLDHAFTKGEPAAPLPVQAGCAESLSGSAHFCVGANVSPYGPQTMKR